MPGYEPTCERCMLCPLCKGNGTIKVQVPYDKPGGTTYLREELTTCTMCGGKGGTYCGSH